MDESNRSAETSYTILPCDELSELVGGFTRHEFMFVLNETLGTRPRRPLGDEDLETGAALLEAAVHGFVALGPDRLQKLVVLHDLYCKQAVEAARRDERSSFWWWINRSEAMTGGNPRTGRLLDLADELVHRRERRDGLCTRPCCDRQWWAKRGFPDLDESPGTASRIT